MSRQHLNQEILCQCRSRPSLDEAPFLSYFIIFIVVSSRFTWFYKTKRIAYSILSGKTGTSFCVHLILKASDHGQLPLSATVAVHILLTMADSTAPIFVHSHYENQPIGLFIIHVEAKS